MDQLPDLLNYKHFLAEHKNISRFNFSNAGAIVQEFESSLWTLNRFSTVILLTLYVPIFLIGLLGNLLIIITVGADKARKTNLYYLVNLALADLTVTVLCMPTSIGTIVYRLWVYGRILCKLVAFIQGVAVSVSIFSMTAMAIDRYISLQRTSTVRRLTTTKQSLVLIICMWIVAAGFMAPLVFIKNVDVLKESFMPELPFCIENWTEDRDKHAYGVFLLFVIFIIPALTIGVCYGHMGKTLLPSNENVGLNTDEISRRQISYRKQAARMLIILICVFVMCWLPYNLLSALSDLYDSVTMASALPFVLWLGHAHSAFNPMLYWSLNKRFRGSVRRLMKVVKVSVCSTTLNSTISLQQYG